MLTAREYLKRTNDNLKTCELHNVIYEYLDGLTFIPTARVYHREPIPDARRIRPLPLQYGHRHWHRNGNPLIS